MLRVLGNARSGFTVLGAVLDSHPQMLVANQKPNLHELLGRG
jgi:hypothetical protein